MAIPYTPRVPSSVVDPNPLDNGNTCIHKNHISIILFIFHGRQW